MTQEDILALEVEMEAAAEQAEAEPKPLTLAEVNAQKLQYGLGKISRKEYAQLQTFEQRWAAAEKWADEMIALLQQDTEPFTADEIQGLKRGYIHRYFNPRQDLGKARFAELGLEAFLDEVAGKGLAVAETLADIPRKPSALQQLMLSLRPQLAGAPTRHHFG